MELVDSLLVGVHEAVRAERGRGDVEAEVDAAVARAFVRYYAEKLKVRPPEKGAEGYCAAIGQWLGEIDVFREAACVESSELIGRLGGSDGEYWAWVWEEGHFFVRTPGTNEMGIRYINEFVGDAAEGGAQEASIGADCRGLGEVCD